MGRDSGASIRDSLQPRCCVKRAACGGFLGTMRAMNHKTIEQTVGNTPLVRLQRMPGDTTNTILVKLEGNNPAGSVKDRPALNMIMKAEARARSNRAIPSSRPPAVTPALPWPWPQPCAATA